VISGFNVLSVDICIAGDTARFGVGWNEAVNGTTGHQPNTRRQTWWLCAGQWLSVCLSLCQSVSL